MTREFSRVPQPFKNLGLKGGLEREASAYLYTSRLYQGSEDGCRHPCVWVTFLSVAKGHM